MFRPMTDDELVAAFCRAAEVKHLGDFMWATLNNDARKEIIGSITDLNILRQARLAAIIHKRYPTKDVQVPQSDNAAGPVAAVAEDPPGVYRPADFQMLGPRDEYTGRDAAWWLDNQEYAKRTSAGRAGTQVRAFQTHFANIVRDFGEDSNWANWSKLQDVQISLLRCL